MTLRVKLHRWFTHLSGVALTLSIFTAHSVWARPQFATTQKMNCTGCHFLPQGGGPRKVFGKIFGSKGLPLDGPSPFAKSVYGVWSIDKMSQGRLPLTLSGEAIVARHWNSVSLNRRIGFFYPSDSSSSAFTQYAPGVIGAQSLGFFGEHKYEVNSRRTRCLRC